MYATGPAAAIALSWATWSDAMGQARAALSLTDDEIVAVLLAWHSAARDNRPDIGSIWWGDSAKWGKARTWVKAELAKLAPKLHVVPELSYEDAERDAYR